MLILIDRNLKRHFVRKLLEARFTLRNACGFLNLKYSQGTYEFQKQGVTTNHMRARFSYLRRPSEQRKRIALQLLMMGATPDEILFLTRVPGNVLISIDYEMVEETLQS